LFSFVKKLEKLIEKNYFLNMSAKEAYKAYVRAYASHSMKSVYDVNTLDLKQVASSFGFRVPPFVDLGVSATKKFSASGGKRKMSFQSDKNAKKAKIYKNISKQ
jgi:ATP-dependent RNA helicase DDX18/HAS1